MHRTITILIEPHLANHHTILACKVTMTAVATKYKPVGQRRTVQKTLQSSVEVAGVAEIEQALHRLKVNEPLISKMETLYPKINEVILRYKDEPNIEIEFRLGKLNRGSFDTNVGPEIYQQVMQGLMLYQGWESTKVSNDQIFYGENGRRAVTNMDTDDTVRIIKTKVAKVDHVCEGRPLDVRLGISTEVKQSDEDDNDVYDKVKQRTRYSFVRKNLSIDVSMIKGSPDDLDCDEDIQYQVELEIINPALIRDDYTLYPLVNKVFDLMNVIT